MRLGENSMEEKIKDNTPKRVWIRAPLRNSGSLSMNIPAGIRRELNLHQNATLVITLVGKHFEVRKLDDIPTTDDQMPRITLDQRKKSWRRSPLEKPPEKGGYRVKQPDPKER